MGKKKIRAVEISFRQRGLKERRRRGCVEAEKGRRRERAGAEDGVSQEDEETPVYGG